MDDNVVAVTDELERRTSSLGISQDEARAGKKFVRTFLFSMAIDSPLARMHVVTRFSMAMASTMAALLMIRNNHLDPAGILLILLFTLGLMYFSGVFSWIMRTYALIVPIAMLSLATSWMIFNPVPGNVILFSQQVYSGMLKIGLGVGHLAFLLIAVPIFLWHKNLTHSLVFGLIGAWLAHYFFPTASIEFFQFPFLKPWTIVISDLTVYTAFTKGLGYGTSAFIALALFMAIRDIELIGALAQFGLPFKGTFFASLAARSFSLATNDYNIIDQAQIARGRLIPDKTIFEKIRDIGFMAIPLIVIMITRSNLIAASLQVRGFTRTNKATRYRDTFPFTWVDWVGTIVSPILLVILYVTDFNLTRTIFPMINF